MHKKLETELVSLAHSILQMKNKEDINALHKKAQAVYEKLSVLKFVDTHFKNTPDSSENKEDIVYKIEEILLDEQVDENAELTEIAEDKVEMELLSEKKVEEKADEKADENAEEIVKNEDEVIKEEKKEMPSLQISLEEEFKDAISADIATELFEKATKENPVVEQQTESKKRSLNDSLFKNNIQVGLNDRIAFVKYLFDGSQEDFNRVVSQLNSFKTEKEAKRFIKKLVKPDYNWSGKEEYEQRLTDLIERKFL